MRQFPLMLFAAGFGNRMGALTRDRPKPLIDVVGRSLLDHALALADEAGITRRVANLHYRGAQLADQLKDRNVAPSWESAEILETGGGLRNALPLLGSGPVMTLNTDAVWSGTNPLAELSQNWDDARMSALLLLVPLQSAVGHTGTGDFLMAADGRITRASGQPGLVYVGAQIVDPAGLHDIPQSVFSLNVLWDRLIAEGRAFGILHDGAWCDVGRPEGIALAEAMLAKSGNV
ncbi:MAG: nucleotidyltransferase family protein [Paracoccaceae bacterium]